MTVGKLFRTNCTACDSSAIKWYDQAQSILPALPLSAQAEARDMIAWYGETIAQVEAWRCTRCHHFGFIESGGLEGATLI